LPPAVAGGRLLSHHANKAKAIAIRPAAKKKRDVPIKLPNVFA
jgi:hypothetical protein